MANLRVSTLLSLFSYGNVGMCVRRPSKASLIDCILRRSRKLAAWRCWACCEAHLVRRYLGIRLVKSIIRKGNSSLSLHQLTLWFRCCSPDHCWRNLCRLWSPHTRSSRWSCWSSRSGCFPCFDSAVSCPQTSGDSSPSQNRTDPSKTFSNWMWSLKEQFWDTVFDFEPLKSCGRIIEHVSLSTISFNYTLIPHHMSAEISTVFSGKYGRFHPPTNWFFLLISSNWQTSEHF